MDQRALLGASIRAGADLIRRLGLLRPVRAAFWLRGGDDDRGHLFIAIEGWDGADSRPIRDDEGRIGRDVEDSDFDPSRVRLIDATDPRARAAIDLNERYPDPKGHRTGPMMFGDAFAEDVHVYPTPNPAAVG